MALTEKTGRPRTHVGDSESEALATNSETESLAEHTQPRLNGSINTRVEGPPEDHVIVAFFKSYGAVIIAATFGVIGSLAAAGFIAQPATKSSVDDLAITLQAYIKHHDELHSVQDRYLRDTLTGIQTTVQTISERTRQDELWQARIDGVLRTFPPVQTPPLLPPDYVSPDKNPVKRKPSIRTAP